MRVGQAIQSKECNDQYVGPEITDITRNVVHNEFLDFRFMPQRHKLQTVQRITWLDGDSQILMWAYNNYQLSVDVFNANNLLYSPCFAPLVEYFSSGLGKKKKLDDMKYVDPLHLSLSYNHWYVMCTKARVCILENVFAYISCCLK